VARATELIDWVRSGQLSVHIGAEFPLGQAGEAHRVLAGRQTMGKVILVP
jgi:NADPH2:quinone reductase